MKKAAQIRGDAIRKARESKGWSQETLGKAVGITQPAIKKIEDGLTIKSRYMTEIEQILGLTKAASGTNMSTQPDSLLLLSIYGLVEDGTGSVIISDDVVDTIQRPERLASVPDAYGLYVIGEQMVPRYRPGDLLLIHPHLVPRKEDGVVIYSAESGLIQVKEFVGSTRAHWLVKSYRPDQETELARDEWPRIHVIYGSYSR